MSAYNDMLNIIMSRLTGLLFVAFVLVAVAITLLANRSEKEGLTVKTPPAVYRIDSDWCNKCSTEAETGHEICTAVACFPRYLKTKSDLNPYDLCGTNQIIDIVNQNCIERNISTKNNKLRIKDSEDKPIWELKRNGDIKLLQKDDRKKYGTIIDKQEVMKLMKNSYEKIFKEKYGSSEEPVIEDPVVEEPIVEEPVVEEPIVEEPVVEEPVVEEPVDDEDEDDEDDEDEDDEDDKDDEDDTNVFLMASIVIGSLAALVGGGYYIKKSRTAVYI